MSRLHTITKSVANMLKELPSDGFKRTKWRSRAVGTPDYDMMFQMMREQSGAEIQTSVKTGGHVTFFFEQDNQFAPIKFEARMQLHHPSYFGDSQYIGDDSIDPRNKEDWEVALELLHAMSPMLDD